MSNPVEFGIKISINGNKDAVGKLDDVKKKTDEISTSADTASQSVEKMQKTLGKTTGADAAAEGFDRVTTSASQMSTKATAAINEASKAQQSLGKTTAQLTVGQLQFLDSLRSQAAAAGLSKTQLLELRAAELGVSGQAADLIKQIDAGTKSHVKFGTATAASTRELAVLGREAVSGNWTRMTGSLTVLAGQMGLMQLLLNPVTLGVIGLGVAGVGLYESLQRGHDEMVLMDNALLVTTNYAGMTRASIESLADSMTQTKEVTIGTAQSIVTQLVASGRIGADAIGVVARLASDYAKSTGQDIDKIAPKLISLFSDPAKGAEELNQTMHFLTTAQLEQIASLERLGDKQQAQLVLAQALTDHLPKQAQNVGTLTKLINEEADAWSKLYNNIKNAGADRTVEQQAQDLRDAISQSVARGVSRSDTNVQYWQKQLDALEPVVEAHKRALELQKQENAESAKQAQAWDLIKGKSEAYHLQALKDELALIEARKSEAGPNFAAQEAAKQDAIRATRKEIEDGYRQMGAEARQQAQEEIATDEAIRQTKIKMAADEIETQYQLGNISKQQHDERMNQNKLEALESKITFEEQSKQIAGLTADEKRRHDLRIQQLYMESNALDAAATNQSLVEQKKIQDASDEAINKYISDLNSQAQSIEQSARAHAKSKSAVESETVALYQLAIANAKAAAAAPVDSLHTAADVEAAKQMVIVLGQEAAAHQRLAAALQQEESAQAGRKALEELDRYLDPARAHSFGTALADGFNGAGDAIGRMVSALAEAQKQQAQLAKAQDDASKAYLAGILTETQYADKQHELNRRAAQIQIADYASIAGAAKGFFDQNSKEYKALQAIEQSYHAAELAMTLKATAAKLFGLTSVSTATVAAAGTQIAAGEAATAASIVQSGQTFAAAAPGAIAKAGSQTGWVGAIAMAALMAALGFAASGGFNTGGDIVTAADRQKTQGTGTVLGDAEAKSDSISKSIDRLSKNSDITLTYTSQMLTALNSIDAAMSGLAAIVARTVGISTGNGIGVFEGTLSQNTGDPIVKMLSGFDDSILTKNLPILGGVVNKLQTLWGKVSQEITDSGLSINGSISDLAKGEGVGQYTDVTKTESSFFGLVKHSSSSTVAGAVDAQVSQQFGLIFKGLEDSLSAAAGALGLDADKARQAVDSVTVTASKISLRGLSGQALTDAINNVISSVFDSASANVIGGLQDFQKVGEGYYETVIRVASGVETAKSALERLGVTAASLTEIANKQGDVAAELVRASILNKETASRTVQHFDAQTITNTVRNPQYQGATAYGASYHNAADGAYAPTITTTSTIAAYDIVTKTFTGIGQIMENLSGSADDLIKTYTQLLSVQTQMKDVGSDINGLTVSTIQGAGSLDALSSGLQAYFDNFFTDTEKAAAQTDDLRQQFAKLGLQMPTGIAGFRHLVDSIDLSTSSGQKLYGQVLLLADSFSALTKQAESAAASAVSDAESALRSAYNNQAHQIQSSITNLNNFAKSIKNFGEALLTGNQSILTPLQKYEAARQAAYDTVAAANAAVNPNDAAAVAAKADAQSKEQGAISAFLDISKAFNASSDAYKADFQWAQEAVNSSVTAATNQASIEQQQLDSLKSQVGELITINDSVLTVADAIFELRAALLTQQSVSGSFNSSLPSQNSGSILAPPVKNMVYPDGSHADGLWSVPFDGYIAELHKGERVLTASQADYLDSAPPIEYGRYGRADTAPLIAEIRSLREEVKSLRAERKQDSAEQTAAMIRANLAAHERSSDKIVNGGVKAAEAVAWKNRSMPKYS